MQDAFAHCAELVRGKDKDRFLASLYAPLPRRAGLHALYAFDLEIARVGTRVHEPMPGEIRLQWWREVLDGSRTEEARLNPISAALLETIEHYGLPRAPLEAAIDAHTFDLYDDPMPTLPAFERYARDTTESVMRLAVRVLGADAPPGLEALLQHGGVALALTGALARFPSDVSRGRLFLPHDVLERHGAAPADVFAGKTNAALTAALAELRAHARSHLAAARGLLGAVPTNARPAFLQLALAPLTLDRMERPDYDPFRTPVEIAAWRRLWALWRAARRL